MLTLRKGRQTNRYYERGPSDRSLGKYLKKSVALIFHFEPLPLSEPIPQTTNWY